MENYIFNDEQSGLVKFREIVAQAGNENIEIWIKLVASRRTCDDGWTLLLGTVSCAETGLSDNIPEILEYDTALYISSGIESLEKIDEIISFKSIAVSDFIVSCSIDNFPRNVELMPSKIGRSPFYRLVFNGNSREGSSSSRLINYDNPFYQDIYSLIREKLPIDPFHGPSDARLGSLLVEIQSFSGRFVSINRIDDSSIVITSEIKTGQARIKTFYCSQNGKEYRQEHQVTGPETTVKVPADARFGEIVGVSEGGSIIDFVIDGGHISRGIARIFQRAGVEQGNVDPNSLDELLRQGEGIRLEYKPFFPPDPGNEKLLESVQTVIAFANTRGGDLLIGVNNYSEPKNDAKKYLIRMAKSTDIESASERYCRELKTHIRDHSVGDYDLTILHINHAGSVIFLVRVGERIDPSRLVALRHGNDVLIRSGASNRRPTPDELAKLFISDKPGQA